MKQIVKHLLILVITVFAAFLGYHGFSDADKEKPEDIEYKAPSRWIEAGPYGQGVRSTEKIGDYTINMKAEKLYFKKTKTFGFDNALFKKLVARELNITIFRDDKRVLALYKDRQAMSPDMKSLLIEDPTVLHPKTIKQLDKISIDKNRRLITLYHSDRTDVWDLNLE
ncbi:MAG: hypothetical protein BA873_11105 [Desulfobulbaceae bacterium C00003063]|nr:MAG: hypothetical protein BA873_11105 [Desulfobulbaceae bacterium C00003063]OEU80300.1 MAG: hypothetical protein BA865_00700 [Desulfobacterales bacterium S5133MH4]